MPRHVIIKRGKLQKRWFMLYGYDLHYYEDPDDLKTKKVRRLASPLTRASDDRALARRIPSIFATS